MTRIRSPHDHAGVLAIMVVSCLLVAAVTLTPVGNGWAWADPLDELRWYLADPTAPSVLTQWAGNVLLLVVPAGCAVHIWPQLGRPGTATALAVTSASAIELAQWLLPLGRVVSPLDAALNAAGAVAAAMAVRLLSGGEAEVPSARGAQQTDGGVAQRLVSVW